MTSLEEAREALDRAVEEVQALPIPDPKNAKLVEKTGLVGFGAVCRLVSLVQKNTHLARVAEESAADYRRQEALLQAEERRALLRLRRLRNTIVAKHRSMAPTPQVTDTSDAAKLVSSFDEFIEEGLKKLGQEGSFFSSGKHKAVERLWQILETLKEHERPESWQKMCATCSSKLGQLRRARHVLDESSPGKRWLWLTEVPASANPAEGFKLWLSESDSFEPPALGPVYKLVHGSKFLDEPECRRTCDWLSDVQMRLQTIATDFQARLGQRASTAWILARYASRSRRLRQSELRQMLAALSASDKPELALTRDAAVFLFDQGFEVLTEQSMGTHRYDILGEPLLVEAKIYNGNRRGLAAVADGLAQIHQYANTLADEGVNFEPVLLVFRLGGPRATPVPEYRIGNLRVIIAHVDLGDSTESGSNAPAPEPDITEAAITGELARRRAHRPPPSARPKQARRGRAG